MARRIDRDLSKLPRWAREHIEALASDVEHLKEEMTAMLGKEASRVNVEYLIDHQTSQPLPEHVTISFCLGESKERFRDSIDVRLRQNMLHISGCREIQICPEAANVVSIKLEDR